MDSKFRAEVGRMILIGAIAYCGLVTLGLIVSTFFNCTLSQPARDMLVIILTWFTTKAGTVVDHQFGSSQRIEAMQEKKKEEEPCEPIDPKAG